MDEKKKKKLQTKADKILQQIQNKGWNPKIGLKLANIYFDMGESDKAEEEYFKYLDETKNPDNIPAFTYMKWAADRGHEMKLMSGTK